MFRRHRSATLAVSLGVAARRGLASLLVLLVQALALPVQAQGGPPHELRRVVDAAVAMLAAADAASAQAFAQAHLAPSYLSTLGEAGWGSTVERLRKVTRAHRDGLAVEAEPDGVRLVFGGPGGPQVRLSIGARTDWKVTAVALVPAGPGTAEGGGREQAVGPHARAIEAIGTQPPDRSLQRLQADHFAEGLFTGPALEALRTSIAALQPVIAGAGMIQLAQRDDGYVLAFRGDRQADVHFAVGPQAPHRITRFAIDLAPPVEARPMAPPLRWEALASTFEQAERDGFAGVVVALRRGEPVLARGFGRSGPGAATPTVDTVFDIGSMPIDFTRAAVLGLAQDGRLSLEDPIGRHLAGVPADKAGITLAQLMDGRSGLANFHAREGDADKDLAWIDRETALARIFAQPLLFAPGTGRSHSHSAFGLLAVVVERVSGQSYGSFLRERLFVPAAMARTGFYGESLGLPDDAFAVGGGQAAATPNIPPRWGRASWLVIGSGGMVSSVSDMRRGHEHIAAGRWLRGDWLQRYLAARVGIGGSDRGFLFLRVTAADGSAVYLASHSHRGPGADEHLIQGLIGMVLPDRATPARR